MKAKILVVDDDPDILTLLRDRLESTGYDTVGADDGQRAIEAVERDAPDILLLDLEMPRLSGLDVLAKLAQARQQGRDGFDLPVIVMTAHGTIDRAVDAMKAGAYDFLTKPVDLDHLAIVLAKSLEREVLKRQVDYLRQEVGTRYAAIVGTSPQIQTVIAQAQRAAESDANILLLGESGTGKELFARSIHQWSPRRAMPFVVLNCVALPDTLLENELFGHEKGAYTGADRQQKGKLETADGGTVFLDEIGDMPLPLQSSLLRVLQDREFHRVGGTRLVRVNIRILAATNKNLKDEVKAGRFREDLFFRLNVVTLTLPPLRERPGDIPPLTECFLRRYAQDAKRPLMRLADEALAAITRHSWPGNIRELDNAIARAVVLCPGDTITPEYLGLSPSEPPSAQAPANADSYLDLPYHESMDAHSRAIILRALGRTNGSQTKAAELLQLQRTYLARLIRQKGISGSKPPAR